MRYGQPYKCGVTCCVMFCPPYKFCVTCCVVFCQRYKCCVIYCVVLPPFQMLCGILPALQMMCYMLFVDFPALQIFWRCFASLTNVVLHAVWGCQRFICCLVFCKCCGLCCVVLPAWQMLYAVWGFASLPFSGHHVVADVAKWATPAPSSRVSLPFSTVSLPFSTVSLPFRRVFLPFSTVSLPFRKEGWS